MISRVTLTGMKYIGIDYGTKNIGLAVSDDNGTVAFPLTTVEAGRDAISKGAALIKENGCRPLAGRGHFFRTYSYAFATRREKNRDGSGAWVRREGKEKKK